ncbi:hypothetical protein GCM10007927_39720 [Sulfitobacter pacificus]|uniref:Uncharacterized protein n=1 Tax=Sulfitobacter pacificus TaxID=1499314 RepID=A0ABQ5VQF2_9RHOB|nr:hypothetical protein GCM10007927_39720 [Sulfitobacter pacificus]
MTDIDGIRWQKYCITITACSHPVGVVSGRERVYAIEKMPRWHHFNYRKHCCGVGFIELVISL